MQAAAGKIHRKAGSLTLNGGVCISAIRVFPKTTHETLALSEEAGILKADVVAGSCVVCKFLPPGGLQSVLRRITKQQF
jgi:hypothetical protein